MATTTPDRADLLLRGGRVHTVDAHDRVVEALAIAGDRVVAAGAAAELEGLSDGRTRVAELRGRSVLPGFVEAHNHMSMYGTGKLADLLVLDGCIEQTPVDRIAEIPVAATLVGGETVHGSL